MLLINLNLPSASFDVMTSNGAVGNPMNNANRYLPYSGRRYSVTENGDVLDIAGNVIVPTMTENGLMIDLEWVLGSKQYLAATVVMVAYEILTDFEFFIDKVKPIYKDDDNTNVMPVNLTYGFNSVPLQVEGKVGFFHVPHFTRYCINTQGDFMNLETGQFLTWNITKPSKAKNDLGGYRYLRAVKRPGESKLLFRHRALCLAFKPTIGDPDKQVVNHIDGIPGRDELSNLEWSTYAKNNRHAYDLGLRGNAASPIAILDIASGEVQKYVTIQAAARDFGRLTAAQLQWRAAHPTDKLYPDRLVVRYDNGNVIWPDLKNSDAISIHGKSTEIMARNVFTGELQLFSSGEECGRVLGVSPMAVRRQAQNLTLGTKCGYNFRFLSANVEWPIHSSETLKKLSRSKWMRMVPSGSNPRYEAI